MDTTNIDQYFDQYSKAKELYGKEDLNLGEIINAIVIEAFEYCLDPVAKGLTGDALRDYNPEVFNALSARFHDWMSVVPDIILAGVFVIRESELISLCVLFGDPNENKEWSARVYRELAILGLVPNKDTEA
jgi:hypothetical protein